MKLDINTNANEIEDACRPLNFHVPPGDYRIRFVDFRDVPDKKSPKPKLRVLWDVVLPSSSSFNYRVWKEYNIETDPYNTFRKDLLKVFSGDLGRFHDESGLLDTDLILGEEAEAKIGQKSTSRYNKPLIVVDGLFPVGHFHLSNLQRPFSK